MPAVRMADRITQQSLHLGFIRLNNILIDSQHLVLAGAERATSHVARVYNPAFRRVRLILASPVPDATDDEYSVAFLHFAG